MPLIAPQGAEGCTLFVRADRAWYFALPGGSFESRVVIPDDAAFVGLELYHQVVFVEFDPAGELVTFSGTNGLRLAIGRF